MLSEDVWTNSKNKLTAENTANGKKMDVYTYLGENGVYFAFDVKDNALFYNPGRRQSRNSGVEVYLTTLEHFKLESGCVSIRLTPTGEGNEAVVSYYRPNGTGNKWMSSNAKGKYLGALRTAWGIPPKSPFRGNFWAWNLPTSFNTPLLSCRR